MKRILMVVLIGALGGCLLWGSDFWKEKKYTEWSDKEIDKILRDSPWAKTVTVSLGTAGGGGAGRRGRGGRGGGAGGGFGGPEGSPAAGPGSGSSEPGVGGAGGRSPVDELGPGGATGREIQVRVRWQSALPIRQAFARLQVQSGKMTPEQCEKYIQLAPDRYVIVLSGMPVPAMAGTTPEKLKAATHLKTGEGQRIALENVLMSQGPGRELFFVFPHAAEPLSTSVKNIEFVTTLGRFEIRKKFSLKDMLVEGKPEL